MNAEKYFAWKHKRVHMCRTIFELLDVMSCDINEPMRTTYQKDLKKQLNSLTRGNLEKCKEVCARMLNEYEHTYYSE